MTTTIDPALSDRSTQSTVDVSNIDQQTIDQQTIDQQTSRQTPPGQLSGHLIIGRQT